MLRQQRPSSYTLLSKPHAYCLRLSEQLWARHGDVIVAESANIKGQVRGFICATRDRAALEARLHILEARAFQPGVERVAECDEFTLPREAQWDGLGSSA